MHLSYAGAPSPYSAQKDTEMKDGNNDAYKPEFAVVAKAMCRLGATDYEVYTELGIGRAAFYKYRILHPDFKAALALGKKEADERVERSLYHRAVGYTYDSEKLVTVSMGKDMGSEVQRHPVVEHIPPDPRCIEYWLNNRKPRNWQHKVTTAIEGNLKFETIQRDTVDLEA